MDALLTERKAASARQRQAAYRTQREALGLVQVAVWVPSSRRADVHAEASRLRLEVGLLLPGEEVASQLSLFPSDL